MTTPNVNSHQFLVSIMLVLCIMILKYIACKNVLQGHPTQSGLFENAIKQRQVIFERRVHNFTKQCCGTIQFIIGIKLFLV